ncbi:glutamyl endopeptidase [Paenibacillus sp. DS2363]|uniref:trypsin-like serine peptidase n=1 Tax=Paenibacillus sp. DS2363 TaxID=3156427 RepID=UPI0033962260
MVNLNDMVSNNGEIIPSRIVSSSITSTASNHGAGIAEINFTREVKKLPSIEEVELDPPQDVCPPDERIKVSETTKFPWRSICRLIITREDGLVAVGTGWFIGKNTIATAGHCVYSDDLKKWHKSIIVVPGLDHDKEPFGNFKSTEFWSVKGWTENGDKEYDYGAILLDNDLGEKIGYFGLRTDPDSLLQNKTIVNSGYPTDRDDVLVDTQWKMSGTIKADDLTERKIQYLIDTHGGNSGGPLWLEDGLYQAICIHAYGGCPNSGTRINREVFNNLMEWISIGDR